MNTNQTPMQSYRYTLEPYKGPASRYICPQCTSKRRTFVRYIDTETGFHLASHVGRCGRQDSCGYHCTPKQYFEHNAPLIENRKQSGSERKRRSERKKKPPTFTSVILDKYWQATLKLYEQNNFIQYLVTKFGGKKVGELLAMYHVGTSKKWKGATVFWQMDETNTCRTGKIMLYDKGTGKRVKEPYNHVSWVHTQKDEQQKLLFPDFKLKQCLFGEHLLADSNKLVALVESEKTAMIGAIYYPDRIWLATGGKEGITKERCAPICNRDVLIYPDMGSFDVWEEKAKECMKFARLISPPKGAKDGEDIADWLMAR